MEENSKKYIQGFAISIISVVIALVLSPSFNMVADSVTYKDGDRNPGFTVGISPAEIGTNSEGIIDCDGNNGDDSPLCGTAKFPAVSPVITYLPFILAASLVVNVGLWVFQNYRQGVENNSGLITGAVSAAVISLIVLIVIPITFQPLEDAIVGANLNGFPGYIPLLRLAPFMLVVGAFVIGVLLTGLVGHRGRS